MITERPKDQILPENGNPLRGGLKGRLAEDFCVL